MSIASITIGTIRSASAWASCSIRDPIGLGLTGAPGIVTLP